MVQAILIVLKCSFKLTNQTSPWLTCSLTAASLTLMKFCFLLLKHAGASEAGLVSTAPFLGHVSTGLSATATPWCSACEGDHSVDRVCCCSLHPHSGLQGRAL